MRNAKYMWLLLIGLLLPMGGCEFSCSADDDNSVENAIDEVGDEVEDTVDKIEEHHDDNDGER
jgi:hypothetical protein